MPLYAFDGTWNVDQPGTEHDTNVIWFRDAYNGPRHYWEGIAAGSAGSGTFSAA
jgi:hypothetical protein